MRVRQSTLGAFDKCPRSMQYDLELPVYHGGSVRAVGTAYHMGLEHLYLNRGSATLADIVAAAKERFDASVSMKPSHESEETKTAGEFRWDETCPDAETAYDMIEAMLAEYYENHQWPDEYEVVGVEVGLGNPTFWGDHTRVGSIDLVVQKDGWIIGDDHKTGGKMWPRGKEHPRKQNQSPWYTAGLQHLYPTASGYRFCYSIMTYKCKFERRIADVKPEHIAAVDRKAIQVVSIYEGMRAQGLDLPANPASTLCNPKWCDHFDVCEFGKALDN